MYTSNSESSFETFTCNWLEVWLNGFIWLCTSWVYSTNEFNTVIVFPRYFCFLNKFLIALFWGFDKTYAFIFYIRTLIPGRGSFVSVNQHKRLQNMVFYSNSWYIFLMGEINISLTNVCILFMTKAESNVLRTFTDELNQIVLNDDLHCR